MLQFYIEVKGEKISTLLKIRAYAPGGFMSNEMWWFLSAILFIAVAVVWAWIWLKENLPLMAENDNFFTTVKKGKIKAIKIAGKIVGYFGNLFDQNKCAKRDTGKIIEGKDNDLENSFLWKHFGVIWMGFGGSVYTYPFEKMDIIDGKIVPIKTTASSIFLKNRFIVTVDDAETLEMIPIKLVAQLITETVDAGLSLNYDNWINVIEGQVKSACRDFIALKDVRVITQEQLEKEGELFKCVMNLNANIGNKSLEEQIGQKIIGFSVISLEVTDKSVKDALQSKEIADEKQKGKIANAEGDAKVIEIDAEAKLKAKKKEAEGITAIGEARNKVLKTTAEILNKKAAEKLEETRALAEGIKEFKGKALSFGGTGIPFIVADDAKEKK